MDMVKAWVSPFPNKPVNQGMWWSTSHLSFSAFSVRCRANEETFFPFHFSSQKVRLTPFFVCVFVWGSAGWLFGDSIFETKNLCVRDQQKKERFCRKSNKAEIHALLIHCLPFVAAR